MKNKKPDESVIEELKQLSGRIAILCKENNIPFVIGYSLKEEKEVNGENIIHRVAYGLINEQQGIYDSTIALSLLALKFEEIPKEVLTMMAERVNVLTMEKQNIKKFH
ncbi:hypothetical protein C5952_04975 [Cronobacter sakazakii]|uniref:hypothetical protein n=1 Tax=Cronobacter sakazakii TaxID=28141 RepID=UPI000CFD9502|nr:hypothetical protein [Cronobacter sakazakii]ELY6363040.1 hypothetical protein [Cronobacter sakazakii]PQX67361.1 hypothetical protein C5952_04975 [Cronobacter sakazakii]PQY05786.1 hypothetical protein C5936_10895 [Cronobacter sakazakii]